VVIGTKFYSSLFDGDPNGGGPGRKALVQQCEGSLQRLQTGYIDIYLLHNWDRTTPIEETLRGLDDLVTAGKVRYIGFSDIPAWKVAEAQTIAAFRGWSPIIALQVEYSLLERTVEGEFIPMAESLGLGVMPWGPLRRGFLSGKFTREKKAILDSKRAALAGTPTEANFAVIDVLLTVAEELEASPAAVALAWVQNRPGVASTIIGARTLNQLRANLTAMDVILGPEHVAKLNDVSKPALSFPAAYADISALLGFSGTTIDGRTIASFPQLVGSSARS
jgi:aryl-alcohol dehydrogenase-like predicted oxidoreductase